MKKNMLFALWGVLFILCGGLGLIPEPEGAVRTVLTIVSVCFFIPPFLLLTRGEKTGDVFCIRLIRNLSLISLSLTTVLLVLNFLAAMASRAAGDMLHYLLVILSSPMICSGFWGLSLFLWACLLIQSGRVLKSVKK